MPFNRAHINHLFLIIIISTTLFGGNELFAQIAVKAQKTIPITEGPRLNNISKRKKVKVLKNTKKLTQRGGKTYPNYKGQSKFKGSIKLEKNRKKKNIASFRGNVKYSKRGNKFAAASKFRGNTKVNRNRRSANPAKNFRGTLTVKRNDRRKSLNKLKPIYVKVNPQKRRGNAIKKYSGNIKMRRPGSFRHAGSNYRGDIRIKKSRMASRRQARYHGGPVNPLDRAKYRNQLIKNSRKKDGQYGKRPKKRNRKKVKLKYDTREGRIWQNQ